MALPPQPWEFRSAKRLIIMLGGVTVNFILASLLYRKWLRMVIHISRMKIKDGLLIENPVLQSAGFKTGDNIFQSMAKVIEI
jgi:regulator of sigma E protease